MLFAWLLYGAMPALGACPMCGSTFAAEARFETSASPAMSDMAQMGSHRAMAASHSSGESMPCGGAMGHASFCPACLVMPEVVAVDSGKAAAFSYPAPGLVKRLRDARPAPVSPPPRLA